MAALIIASGVANSRTWRNALALTLVGIGASPLHAQAEVRDPTIAELPRAGYQPRTLDFEGISVLPTLDTDVTYNSNIFALPKRVVNDVGVTRSPPDDAVFTINPRVIAELNRPALNIKADAHAGFIRYASTPRENVNTFGFSLDTMKKAGGSQTLTASVAFDRTYQDRSDPEADLDRGLPPSLINKLSGDVSYRYQGSRIGALIDLGVDQLNYLPAADADRDLTTYRASVRGSIIVVPNISVFIQPFVTRRDARLRVDFNGIDRDSTTAGALGGVLFDLTDRLQGNIGFGVFSANPDDPKLQNYTGLAASGRLNWHPRVRTNVSLDLSRGDVATIRAGAIGRIDTNVGIAVDQEARHNLILHGAVGIHEVHYRGINRDQHYLTGTGEARYLFNRVYSIVLRTNYTRRHAEFAQDRFNRWETTLGARAAF